MVGARRWGSRRFLKQKARLVWSGLNRKIPLDIIGYVATIFWIFATIGPRLVDPTRSPHIGDYTQFLDPGQVVLLSSGIALLLHIGVPIGYVVLNRPFYISSTWYPVAWDSEVHQGKYKGHLRMPDSGQVEIMLPMELLDGVEEYELKFESTYPFKLELQDKNNDQDWDRREKVLSSENITHTTFIPRIKLKEDDEVGSGDNYHLTITDLKNNRNTEVLKLEIRD